MTIERSMPCKIGLSLKDSYIDDLEAHLSSIECIEIKPEHYFSDLKTSVAFLHILAERLPLIAHGLKLSIGSADGLRLRHLNRLRRFFKLAPPMGWMGEHLGFSRAAGIEIPHFVNVPYTDEMLTVLANNITHLKSRLSIPVIYENIPWEFSYPESTMEEPEFFTRLVKKAGCDLLLDVTNLYTNSINFGWDLDRYLAHYPIERVRQIHFNGGTYRDGRYIDTHSTPTPPEVWEILKIVLKRAPHLDACILERDDNAPLASVVEELVKAKTYIKRYHR